MTSPDTVTQIVAAVKAKTNLRELQGELYRRQKAARTSGHAQALKKMYARRHALRVRQPALADCKIDDTRSDQAKSRLYFELSNGQVVRADRAAARPGKKGRRKSPFKVRAFRDRIAAEVHANAARAEKKVAA